MSRDKDAAAEKAILGYLNKQNRPYSAVDVFSNLHKEYGKTAVVKCLDGLVREGKLRSKVYGKQTVYVVDQSQYPEIPDSEIKVMDQKIQQMTGQLREAEAKYKKLEAELQGLSSALTTEDATKRLQQTVSDSKRYKAKLEQLKSNNNAVSPEERQLIVKDRTQFVKEWRKRKRMGNDILDAILEGYPKSKKELYEEVGIETDEENNVKPPAS